MRRIILSIFTLPLFVACAHVSKKDCLEKDWQAVGVHDGASGLVRADMSKVADSCSRFDMANPPAVQYATGYAIGQKQYCTAERGFSHGEKGIFYPSVCGDAQSNFPELVDAWKKGITEYCSYEQGQANAKNGGQQNKYCDDSVHAVYFKGFENGARSYCSSAKTAFLRGKNGTEPFPYCPGSLAGPFDRAYAEGVRLYKEIGVATDRLSNLDSRIAELKRRDREAEALIADYQRRIRDLERNIERSDDEIQRVEAELRKCARDSQLCAETYIDSLERQLREKSDQRSSDRRIKGELSIKLPNFFSDRTRFMLEVSNLTNQRPSLVQNLANLEDRDLGDSRIPEFTHVSPKKSNAN